MEKVTVRFYDTDGHNYIYRMSRNAADAIDWFIEEFENGCEVRLEILHDSVEDLDF